MQLNDLGERSRSVLEALYAHGPNIRRALAAQTGSSPVQVSHALNRLENMGFVALPEKIGSPWTITPRGRELFGEKIDPHTAAESHDSPAHDVEEPHSAPDEDDEPLGYQGNPPDSCLMTDDAVATPVTPVTPVTQRNPQSATTLDLMGAMEIELALDRVRTKLRSRAIPARSQRVYRELIDTLPLVLVDALAPITAWVDAQGSLQ